MRRLLAIGVAVVAAAGFGTAVPAAAVPGSATLTTSTRLADRRFVVTGDHFYEVGAADASYPATGWHIRGEMGGFWTPPIKLLDGLWFAADGQWLTATRFTSGTGYVRMDLAAPHGLKVSRVDLAPDGFRFFMILLKVITIFSPLRIFLPISAAAFGVGVAYAAWTIATQSHVTNSSVLLILLSVVIFLVGLVSEQISSLRFEGRR